MNPESHTHPAPSPAAAALARLSGLLADHVNGLRANPATANTAGVILSQVNADLDLIDKALKAQPHGAP